MYGKILVPLDGSPMAEAALAQVAQLAGPATEVLLLRVTEPASAGTLVPLVPNTSGVGGPPMFPPPSLSQPSALPAVEGAARARGEAQDYLESRAIDLRGGTASVRTLVLEDADAAAVIAGQATDEGADLIVMATHGRSGVSRWVLGSVADRVLHSTAVPLLLVRPSAPAA
jgi:nucleotide-binding universal stress UspA family protein